MDTQHARNSRKGTPVAALWGFLCA